MKFHDVIRHLINTCPVQFPGGHEAAHAAVDEHEADEHQADEHQADEHQADEHQADSPARSPGKAKPKADG